MKIIRSHNANVILVMMPLYYLKYQTFNFDDMATFYRYIDLYVTSNEGIVFIDLNKDSLNMDKALFYDPIHFNTLGQRKLTEIISSCITMIDSH